MGKNCPCCKEIELRRAIRRGIEIDYCPDCNGIWLDNGELNKIVTESLKVSEQENSPSETATKTSRKSIFKSFLNVMGSTKNDAEGGLDSDPDFVSKGDINFNADSSVNDITD